MRRAESGIQLLGLVVADAAGVCDGGDNGDDIEAVGLSELMTVVCMAGAFDVALCWW